MRTPVFLAAVASAAIAGAHPAAEEPLSGHSFDKRTDFAALGSKILKTDLYAGVAGINQQLYQATKKPEQWKKCNPTDIVVRREWATFSTAEKKNYISAVQCLMKLPPKTPKAECPGCRSRYDDFTANHIKQTFTTHATGNFLPYHRWYMYAYEQTLRNECGFQGHHPYFNWPRWADNPMKSPLLDGSATSVGGNGELGCSNQTFYGVPSNEDPLVVLPRGSGGGCVKNGPFKDFVVNLGPAVPSSKCVPPNPNPEVFDPLFALGHNPRCLTRDINLKSASRANDEETVKLLEQPDIENFWGSLQGGTRVLFQNDFMGVHSAGHYLLGGDPGSDVFTSPGDPYFYFHHTQVDRVWWIWQNLDPEKRTNAIFGPTAFLDFTTPDAKLTDKIHLGHAYPGEITVADAMSTMAGPFCYTYL